jgi:hypothetical protein
MQLGQGGRPGELPRQRVLTAAEADEENAHRAGV